MPMKLFFPLSEADEKRPLLNSVNRTEEKGNQVGVVNNPGFEFGHNTKLN